MDSKGKILPAVQQMRKERKLAIRKEIEAKALEDLKKIQGKTTAQEDSLYNDIQNDLAKLRTRRTISSIEDNRILDIGNYGGDKYEWDTTVSLYINDVKIFGQNANIGYRNVSGKVPVAPGAGNTSEWNDYLDTVDLYDYMFRRNVPAITLEIEYSVDALSDAYPSMYRMTLYEFRFIDTVSGNVVQSIRPAKSEYRFSVNPTVDISYYKKNTALNTQNSENDSKSENTKPVVEYEEIKTGKKVKKQKKVDPVFDQKRGGGARCNLGLNIAKTLSDDEYSDERPGVQLEGYCSIPLTSFMFMQLDYSWFSIPDNLKYNFGGFNSISMATYGLGINLRPRLNGTSPNFYALASGGVTFRDEYPEKNFNDGEPVYFTYKFAGGIDIPMENFWCFTVEGGVLGFEDLKPLPYVKMGVAFTIPNLIFFD